MKQASGLCVGGHSSPVAAASAAEVEAAAAAVMPSASGCTDGLAGTPPLRSDSGSGRHMSRLSNQRAISSQYEQQTFTWPISMVSFQLTTSVNHQKLYPN